jgi:periplasmic divalent cation tolerance protein
MNSTSYTVALTTVASEEHARNISRLLVEEGLAACVSIMPEVRSFYKWKNQLCEDVELILLIKTRKEFLESIEKFFRLHHPYELPELVLLPIIGGKKEYLQWIDEVLGVQNP